MRDRIDDSCWRILPFVLTVTLLLARFAAGAEVPLTFPPASGVIDVRDLGAKPDDAVDDTALIQRALDAHPNGNRIIYLAPGTWLVSDTLRWAAGEHGGQAQKRTILQGAGMTLTKLRLPDHTAAFAGETPKALIWTGEKPAQRFRNAVRDLTIEIGAGHPHAIGLQFNASNQGCIRNVAIRAAAESGGIGLDLGFTDEIGPLLVRNLEVEGFDVGISTKWPVNSNTFEHVRLRGQRKLGWHNYHQMVFVRGLTSENAVTTLYNEKDSWGYIALLDSRLTGVNPAGKIPGIHNQRQMYLKNVAVSGYPVSVDHADKGRDKGDIVEAGLIAEDTSHATVSALFRDLKDNTFSTAGAVRHLPVKETPEIPWGDPAQDWVSLLAFGADPEGKADATPALQRAIDSGAKTIYLPAAANFHFDGEVLIRGPVARIIGLEGRFFTEGKAVWRLVDGGHPAGLKDAPAVILERCNNRSGGHGILLKHESRRTLVVSSWIGMTIEGRGTGDIFCDDFCGRLLLEQPGQNAWCRQLNTEYPGVMCRNSGANLWILGMKTEKIGTIIETTRGGVTDVAGCFIYSNQGWDEKVPAFVIDNATAALAGIVERNFNRQPVSFWVRETQGGETRELRERPQNFLSR